jgi:hypothetical protein
MVAAFHTKGAAHVLGWTDLVAFQMAADSGIFLIDRLLGTDGYPAYPGNPANRPFNLAEVMAEMRHKPRQAALQHGSVLPLMLTQSAIALIITAELKLDSKPGAPTLALAPTISSVNLHNDLDSLTLYGDFGSPAQTPAVTIGGHQVDAISSSGQITVTGLPRSGDGSGGPIKVTVDGASSNSVMLNQWNNVPIVMTTQNGNWVRTVTCSVNLRGVFDTLRSAPDKTPDTTGVSVDDVVVQNGSCSFVSVNPSLSGPLPWWNFNNESTPPANGVKVFAASNNDGQGGAGLTLSLQAFYDDGNISFLDTSASGDKQMTIDPATHALAAGSANQLEDTLVWSATSPQFTPDPNRSR